MPKPFVFEHMTDRSAHTNSMRTNKEEKKMMKILWLNDERGLRMIVWEGWAVMAHGKICKAKNGEAKRAGIEFRNSLLFWAILIDNVVSYTVTAIVLV